MQMLGLVLLARGATANKILDHRTKVRSVEISVEPLRALDALVAVIMDGEQGRHQGDVEAGVVRHHDVDDRRRHGVLARSYLIPKGHQGHIRGLCLAEALDEVEAGARDGKKSTVFHVPTG